MGYYQTGLPLVSSTIDTQQFGDLEILAVFFDYLRIKKSFWERIGDGGSISGQPIVHNGTIYFGACDHIFYALDRDGQELWRFHCNGRIQGPVEAFDDTVCFGSTGNTLYALACDGKLRWAFTAMGMFADKPVYHAGVIYAGTSDGYLFAVDEATGKERWRFTSPKSFASCPLIYQNKIFHGYEDGNLYCLDLQGNLLWKFPTNGWVAAWPPAALGDTVYFGSFDGNLYAVDIATGKLCWKFKSTSLMYAPLIWNNRIYAPSADNRLYCLDLDGRVLWTFKAQAAVVNASFCGGKAFVSSLDNNLYCLDAATGSRLWAFKINGVVVYTPVFLDGHAIFGSWDCNLYCLDFNGNLLWKFPTSISSPSPIEPPETTEMATLRAVWRPEDAKPQEEKYKEAVSAGSYASFSSYTGDRSYVAGAGKDYAGRKRQ